MKIAYFVNQYKNSGGMERIMSEKANYLVNNGYDVYLIVCSKEIYDTPFFYYDPRIKVVELNIEGKNKEHKRKYLSLVQAQLDLIKPDISISTGIDLTQYIYKLNNTGKLVLEEHFCKYKRKTKIARLATHWYGKPLGYLYKWEKRNIVKKFDKYVVLTNEDREQWFELSDDKIVVIPNMITIPLTEERTDYTQKRIIGIGRLTGQKGWEMLVETWAKISCKHPDWKIVIYGEGSSRRKIESLLNKYSLKDSFKLLGLSNDVPKELLRSSIFVLSSRYEGQGLVILEAMNLGLPVVSFACKCGPKDIVDDGKTGFLVAPYNTTIFAEKLEILINNQELRREMGEKGKISVQRFSPDKIMAKWGELFRDLVK